MVITLQYMHLSRLFIYIKQCFVSIISIKLGGKNEEKRPENSLFEMQTSQKQSSYIPVSGECRSPNVFILITQKAVITLTNLLLQHYLLRCCSLSPALKNSFNFCFSWVQYLSPIVVVLTKIFLAYLCTIFLWLMPTVL